MAFRTAGAAIPEPQRGFVQDQLDRMLKKLEDANRKIPGDRWIAGQRVLHLVEHGELERARTAAKACRSEAWWCASLFGFTSSLLNDPLRADSAFQVALNALPPEQRCTWEDLGVIFEGDPDRDWYTSLPCGDRRRVNETIWWLADPLYLVRGNERRTAHFERMVHTLLEIDGDRRYPPEVNLTGPVARLPGGPVDPATGSPTGRDAGTRLSIGLNLPANARGVPPGTILPGTGRFLPLRDSYNPLGWIILRMGMPAFRVTEIPEAGRPPTTALQFFLPNYRFVPSLAAARSPLSPNRSAWDPLAAFPPEHFHTRFGAFVVLDHQITWFSREDSSLIVASMDIGAKPNIDQAEKTGMALILARSPADPSVIFRTPQRGSNAKFVVATARAPAIVSLEVLARGVGAGRARTASAPPDMPTQRVTASDLLLLEESEALPTLLADAIPLASHGTRIPERTKLGIYWELYGLEQQDSVTFTLTAARQSEDQSVIAGVARMLGQGEDSTRVRWAEQGLATGAVTGRSIALDLSTLRRGAYSLELEMRVPGQLPVTVRRELEIVER
jgi:hypothetical protein